MANRVQIAALLLLGLFAVAAVADSAASRSSSYLGAAGSGPGFKAAKVALLDGYAKAKGVKYSIVSEKVGDNSYNVTYSFPTAAALADFQAWQYKQALYAQKLEKFSQKAKTTGK
jgi:hypothetical protein